MGDLFKIDTLVSIDLFNFDYNRENGVSAP
jgi:hypothetical protein